jgi:hypothetical protein
MRRWNFIISLALAISVLAIAITAQSRRAYAQIGIDITIAPPELPDYDQPPLPALGYIWAPGYWAWGPDGYYWVPGTWVLPPSDGLLWTPGYWGWRDGLYVWNGGYWGPHVGFYGGVNYGYGYGGDGYAGGRWNNGVFAYNRTVNNFGGVHVTNVYNETVVVNNNARTSFNGGAGGLAARPTAEQEAFAHEPHVQPTAVQTQHQQTASTNRGLLASENHGHPAIAATARPNEFSGKGVVAAHEAVGGPNAGANRGPGTNGPNALEKRGPGGNNPAALKGNNQLNTQARPLNTGNKTPGSSPPPPKAARVNPQPHVVSAPKPPPPHPQARPAPRPPAPHPPAPHPAPHPQARPAPHPDNKKH